MSYIYDRRGEPIAYRTGQYLYTLEGEALGYLEGSHVYRLDGPYVGELYRDMVVDRFLSNPGSIGAVVSPGRLPRFDYPGNRGPMDYGYPDVSEKLFG